MFYRVTSFTGDPVNHVFESIRWESRARLPQMDFLDGDVDFVKRLSRGLYRAAGRP
jgi:hypothetical protein